MEQRLDGPQQDVSRRLFHCQGTELKKVYTFRTIFLLSVEGGVFLSVYSLLARQIARVCKSPQHAAAQALQFGVAQGSVLGPVYHYVYTSPSSRLITGFSCISHHLFADVTQVYTSLNSGNSASRL